MCVCVRVFVCVHVCVLYICTLYDGPTEPIHGHTSAQVSGHSCQGLWLTPIPALSALSLYVCVRVWAECGGLTSSLGNHFEHESSRHTITI